MKWEVRRFWEQRARRANQPDGGLGLWQSTCLTNSEESAVERRNLEMRALENAGQLLPDTSAFNLLDIGCGTGRLTMHLAGFFIQVYATDYMANFIDIAKTKAAAEGVDNIHFKCAQSHEIERNWRVQCCSVCGVLCYLDDTCYYSTLETAQKADYVIVKESVGVKERFELKNHYSEVLGTEYNAIYRSRKEIVGDFESAGFDLLMDELVEAHRKETNIRIFVFQRRETRL